MHNYFDKTYNIKKLSLQLTTNRIMKKIILILALTILTTACSSRKTEISSPNKKIHLAFNIDNEGFMSYNIKVNDSIFIDDSQLGFEAKDGLNLKNSFEIIKTEFSSKDET